MARGLLVLPLRTMALLAGAALALYFGLATAQRTAQIYQLKQEELRLQREVAGLEVKYRQLAAERDRLQTDTDIEKVAREELNLIKPGETAVIVVASQEARERALQEPQPHPQEEPPSWLSWLTRFGGRNHP